MEDWRTICRDKLISYEEAVKVVKSGDRVVINIVQQPLTMMSALQAKRDELRNVRVYSDFPRNHPWLQPGWEDSFFLNALFIHNTTRQGVRKGRIEFVPLVYGFLTRPGSFIYGADVGMVRVTCPDSEGYCSFGLNVWLGPLITKYARTVIAEVDPGMIWTYGDRVHISEIDIMVEADAVVEEPYRLRGRRIPLPPPDEAESLRAVGANVASLVRDSDTIQIGLGAASEAAIASLTDKHDLGMDTELVVPEMLDLVKQGVVTNTKKNVNMGKTICTGIYTNIDETDPDAAPILEYVNRNPAFEMHDISWICSIPRLASIDNLVAINNVLTVDLLGQATVDHLGPIPFSGMGGQFDYHMGAHYSKGGRSVSCLLSVAKQGTISRIVPQFETGTVTGIPYYSIDYLVTEHGIVNLEGKNRRERAQAIISIADPKFREELKRAAERMFY